MILVDTANAQEIGRALKCPGVSGFTTNPALIARAAGADALAVPDYIDAARELCRFAAETGAVKSFMIQAVGPADDSLRQARAYLEVCGDARDTTLWIKLAPTNAHVAMCRPLEALGCRTIVTAVFTAVQAHVAMEAGAAGVAVYLGRLMKVDPDWAAQIEAIARLLSREGRLLLLASLPDQKSLEIALRHSRDVTVPPGLVDRMMFSQASVDAIEAFDARIVAER